MTEAVSQRFDDFDAWSTLEAVRAMHEGQLAAIAAISPALPSIAAAIDQAAQRLGDNGRLVYVGAGTSGRLGIQDGAELGPTFGWPDSRTKFCIAGGTSALINSAEGAEDNIENGREAIDKLQLGPSDVVIAVAASGSTPYTLAAMRQARTRGALCIGIANNPDTPILEHADIPVLAETGSEIIAGSTRMKAGTAQKAVLNMVSTGIMTRLGRVHGGLMVDMIPSNKKLKQRAIAMVQTLTNCAPDAAQAALERAGMNIKLAALIAAGHERETAKRALAQNQNNLRKAIGQLGEAS